MHRARLGDENQGTGKLRGRRGNDTYSALERRRFLEGVLAILVALSQTEIMWRLGGGDSNLDNRLQALRRTTFGVTLMNRLLFVVRSSVQQV